MTKQPAAPVMTTLVEALHPDVPSGPGVLRVEGLGGTTVGLRMGRIAVRIAETVLRTAETAVETAALAGGLTARPSGVPRC